jgi:hypothetical protein
VSHFGRFNPEGEGQGDVAALLRRVADAIEELGEIDILDLVFHSETTADEDRVSITVYYYRPDQEK